MARKPRIEFDGAFYHVIARGNQRRDIFVDDHDRLTYLERLEHYRRRYEFILYGYVLMSNHVHLLVKTGRVPLSKIMQGIQASFTQRYNRRHGTVGHLFQGRYKAILCDGDAYLLELVRYIHLNPARVEHAQDPWKYRWSSHQGYLGEHTPVKVEAAFVLEQFGATLGQARRAYMKFMEEGIGLGHVERFYETVDQRFLGDERFVEQIENKTQKGESRKLKASFGRLLKAVAAMHDVEPGRLVDTGRSRRWVKARSLLVYAAREWAGVRAKELGEQLHRDASMISRLYASYAANRDRKAEARLLRLLGA
ncbi:MAG: transposase [Candidatus Binatia bacterium]